MACTKLDLFVKWLLQHQGHILEQSDSELRGVEHSLCNHGTGLTGMWDFRRKKNNYDRSNQAC